ncbi:MAG: SelB C-terminal domain-containing protein, partial [Chloroflexota bacterium]|nr:SelB C-terminal domain-containing protein [Chloroflexota bacterium]
LQAREPADLGALVGRTGLSADEASGAVRALIERGEVVVLDQRRDGAPRLIPTTLLVSRPGWDRLVDQVRSTLGGYHRSYPLRRGMPKEEVRTRLGLDARLFVRLLDRVLAEGLVVEAGPFLRLPEHAVTFTPEQERQARLILEALEAGGASPPSRDEVEARFGASPELTQALLDRGDLVEVASDLVYPREVYATIVDEVTKTIRERGPITVASVRDLFDTSRKFALAILAHLDERKITRRVGDERVLY